MSSLNFCRGSRKLSQAVPVLPCTNCCTVAANYLQDLHAFCPNHCPTSLAVGCFATVGHAWAVTSDGRFEAYRSVTSWNSTGCHLPHQDVSEVQAFVLFQMNSSRLFMSLFVHAHCWAVSVISVNARFCVFPLTSLVIALCFSLRHLSPSDTYLHCSYIIFATAETQFSSIGCTKNE